jgi:hypothetical protein
MPVLKVKNPITGLWEEVGSSDETVTQAEAEAGTSTLRRVWTAERVRQAIAAWWTALTVGPSKITMSTARLLGRSSAGTGPAEEIAIGSGLSLSGGTLTATGGGGGGSYEVATFADLPDATTVTVGRTYTVLGPVCTGGVPGTHWASDGVRWRPAGTQVLAYLTATVDGVSGGTTAEQFLFSPLFDAGVLRGCRTIRCQSRNITSANDTNSRALRWRVGATGTSSDFIFSSLSGTATQRQVSVPGQFVPASDTTARFAAGFNATPQTPDLTIANAAANPADFTVGDMTGQIYISATTQQGASPVATVSIPWAQIIAE